VAVVGVISVHKITGGAAAGEYYLDRKNACEHQLEQPGDRAGYYTDSREAPGLWLGRGAEALGLTGGLDRDGQSRFRELLQGRLDGDQLARPVMRGRARELETPGPSADKGGKRSAAAIDVEEQVTRQRGDKLMKAVERSETELDRFQRVPRPDPQQRAQRRGQRRAQPDVEGGLRDVRVSAYDVTLSAPKSVSVLRAMSTTTGDRVAAGHDHAAEAALTLLEQLAARAARGHHGDGQAAPRIATSGFIAAAFDHTTSRALDPQTHTHVVVMNLVQGEDGRWSALDSLTLFRQATTASYLYQHLLRAELTREFGIAWGPIDRGVAEIIGVPRAVCREFSTRRAQIETILSGSGATGLKGKAKNVAARAACLTTRPAKQHADPNALREDWIRRGTARGFGPEQAEQLLHMRHVPAPIDRMAIRDRVLGEDGVTRERATFDQGTVLRELICALPPGSDVGKDELLAWTRELLTDDSVVTVAGSAPGSAGPSYTTRGMLAAEQRLLTLATRNSDRPFAQVDPSTVIGALLTTDLRIEQRDLAHFLLTRGRPVEVVSGPAGSGKTHGLHAAVTLWTEAGVEVRGTAVAALAAKGLQDATGAASVSTARLLNQPDRHVPQDGVLLVDEAGMIGTHQLLRLLTVARRRDCKVVLVGDPAQLPEIEAGGAFATLTHQSGALSLEGHGRQTEKWERQALYHLRRGDPAALLDAYAARDRLHVSADSDALRTGLVADYLTARRAQSDPWQVAVLAPHRRDVTDLNSRIRQQLVKTGVLGRRSMKISTANGQVDFRKGDQVIVTRNHHDRDLLNGTRGTVRSLRRDALVVQLFDGRRVALDKPFLSSGDLDHGYAMTLHKAQGRTVATSLVLADETLSQEGGYVGLSRGTTANHLYLETATNDALRDCSGQRAAEPSDPTGSRVLTRISRHDLASDLVRDRPSTPSRSRSEGLSR
jgi:conjugative relaxase-like TrwC/TraI family protein